MLNTKEAVNNHDFVNEKRLLRETNGFGLVGRMIEYENNYKPQDNGVYFVAGYDIDTVSDENINISEIYKKQCTVKGVRLDLHITKITDQSPFNAHEDLMNYCLHASTMRGLYNMFNYSDPPMVVSASFITLCEAYYVNSINKDLDFATRARNEMVLSKFIVKQGEIEEEFSGKISDDTDIYTKPEKITKDSPKNMVKPSYFTANRIPVKYLITTVEFANSIQRELSKHPEIKFTRMKPVYAKLNVNDNEGLGSRKLNQMSSVTFLYDANYEKDVDLISLLVECPSLFKYSLMEIKKSDKRTVSFGVSAMDLETVFKSAREMGVPCCLDTDRLYFSTNPNFVPEENIAGYAVTIAEKDSTMMNNLLVSLMNLSKDLRILTPSDESRFCH